MTIYLATDHGAMTHRHGLTDEATEIVVKVGPLTDRQRLQAALKATLAIAAECEAERRRATEMADAAHETAQRIREQLAVAS